MWYKDWAYMYKYRDSLKIQKYFLKIKGVDSDVMIGIQVATREQMEKISLIPN